MPGRTNIKLADLVGVFAVNSADTSSIIPFSGINYIVPPRCSFLLSDVSNPHLLPPNVQYDLIVMDPPWENKSVKRKKNYQMVRDFELEDIPIGQLATDGCLVVTWVTNKQQQQQLVKETLFPKWGITPLATWYWLKVTTEGEPVYPMRSQHSKKPYEALILGCKSLSPPLKIPDHKVILSIPSCIHSHKPPLHDILQDFLPSSTPRCLEIFARSLHPRWTSWGNEVSSDNISKIE
ncbi:hypothetical protein CAPTEDRAFT_94532 [Capitella teleta]|uniref:Methyltransferase-like protein 4 n=1 Tax=Capitella teleta TaxID=283909 RepID=R7UFP3_CAPTE|nr:hypothetical protein CAPTEDRAFT_94532 [Capitella teleta]|eukprot:ELU04918.1 hypothetical protein CAPTEDRAFT_94532 [Capitella teleta]